MDSYSTIKRIFDIFFSLLFILLLLPLSVPFIIALRLSGEGKVWYRQERIGFGNKKFHILKFATMLVDSPNMAGGIITRTNDPRLTPLGGILRKTKINELPQLVNILRGDMSFVGPRPVMQQSFDQYPADVQAYIYNVPPGITGIGSIVFRNEEHIINQEIANGGDPWELYTEKIYPYKGELELWYQNNRSLSLDVSILLSTAWTVAYPNSNLIFKLFPSLPTNAMLSL